MSYAELKTLVNSKMPGQKDFAPIDAMIRELQAQTQKESEYYHIFAPKFNMNNVISLKQIYTPIKVSELMAKSNKTITVFDIEKKGLLFAYMQINIYANQDFFRYCSGISGEASVDFGYGALTHQFNKEIRSLTSTSLFNMHIGTLARNTSHQIALSDLNPNEAYQLVVPYPLQVSRFKVTYRYVLHGFRQSDAEQYKNHTGIIVQAHPLGGGSNSATIIGGLNE